MAVSETIQVSKHLGLVPRKREGGERERVGETERERERKILLFCISLVFLYHKKMVFMRQNELKRAVFILFGTDCEGS